MSVDFGYRSLTVRLGSVSGRIPSRTIAISLALLLSAVLAAFLAMTLGEYRLGLDQVVGAFTGASPVDALTRTIVLEWRSPVALAAVVFGAVLGLSGAVFQSLTRNPLGSPDVMGFDAGSYTAVIISVIVLGGGGYWSVATASLIGGLGAATAVYLLAYRRGAHGFRLIIVGIAVSAMLGSLNAYLITRADIDDALTVGFWGAGSLNRVTWASMLPSLGLALLLVAAAALVARRLRTLEAGDDVAITQGTRPGPTRLLLVLLGVATTALVTAAAGPIGFIALAAPHLARRVIKSSGTTLLGAAAMGAALLAAAHLLSLLIAEVLRPVPVGLITVCLGGAYLIWLLVQETRHARGAIR